MSKGLTFNANSVKVQLVSTTKNEAGEDVTTTTDVAAEYYTVTSTGLADGCTFEVAFTNEYISNLTAGDKLVVSYSATLNSDAVVGLDGNDNKVKLQYGDENKPAYSEEDTTITYTWDMDVLKYADGNKENVLSGAQFYLLNNDKTKAAVVVGGKLTGWATITADENGVVSSYGEATLLTTDDNGKIEIDGLDADNYYLREYAAPAGYNLLTEDVKVEISGAESENDGVTLTYATVVAEVENKSGSVLPSTGGMGTTVLYAVGGLLVLVAFVLIVSKRRASEN